MRSNTCRAEFDTSRVTMCTHVPYRKLGESKMQMCEAGQSTQQKADVGGMKWKERGGGERGAAAAGLRYRWGMQ